MDWVKERFFPKIEELVNEFSNGSLNLILEIGSKASTLPATKKTVKRTDAKKSWPK
jgi:chromosomal replication initiator protein